MASLSIGEVARISGITMANIRYYESIALLGSVKRSAGGQRAFAPDVLDRLRFIKSRRALGFSIAQVRALLASAGPQASACAEARDGAVLQLAAVRQKIAALGAIEAELTMQLDACDAICSITNGASCALLPASGSPPTLR